MKFSDIKALPYGSYQVDLSLTSLIKFVEEEIKTMGLQMNPDFQRGNVWTEEQQISYVEFILRGGRSGKTLFFNCPSWYRPVKEGAYDEYVCVDGLQRYTAIKRFIENEIPAFGYLYNEYEDSIRLANTISININQLETKKEVVEWYLDFNDGGTPHSREEIQRVRELLKTLK